MQSNWPPAHSEALREYHARGMSYSMIADAINIRFKTAYSRNATLGRAKRMGLADAGQPKDRVEPPSVAEASNLPKTILDQAISLRSRKRATSEPWLRPPVFKTIEPAALRCANVVPRHLSLLDLSRGDCRYPYGGNVDGEAITFCGHPRRRGSSYCAAHFKLSIGPGTAAERAVDLLLKIAEAV